MVTSGTKGCSPWRSDRATLGATRDNRISSSCVTVPFVSSFVKLFFVLFVNFAS